MARQVCGAGRRKMRWDDFPLTCSRRASHAGDHGNRGTTWPDRCGCGELTFVPTVHAMCMNCAGHNPRCSGRHCDSHPKMLAGGTFNGRTYCRACG